MAGHYRSVLGLCLRQLTQEPILSTIGKGIPIVYRKLWTDVDVCMHTCLYVCIHVCICLSIHCMYICMKVCMYVCMYYMYVCIH